MRIAGSDYIKLFKSFPLLPLETDQDAEDAVKWRDWLDTRTHLSKSALQYQEVLKMLIIDFEVRKLDEPDLPSAADLDMPPIAAHACTDDDPGEDEEVDEASPYADEETADDVTVSVPDDEGPEATVAPKRGRKRR